jgi:adenylate cyclase class 2
MQTEIEAKFIKQNHDQVREKLKDLGAELVTPERVMRRSNFDFPDLKLEKQQRGWVRIRDEGDKITLSYKQSDDSTVEGMQEVNVTVDSFENAELFLNAVGISNKKAYQETKRETWNLDGVAIELDTWPWIEPFVEIEAPSHEKLLEAVNKLGFDINNALFGSVIPAYQAEYDITPEEMAHWPEYRLEEPIPQWLKDRKKAA